MKGERKRVREMEKKDKTGEEGRGEIIVERVRERKREERERDISIWVSL